MRSRTYRPQLERLEDRCTPSCVSDSVTPFAPLGGTVTLLVQAGLPGGGSTFGQDVMTATGTSLWGSNIAATAQTC